MSKNRTGNFIAGGNPQIPSLSSNNGVFDNNEVYENVSLNRWQSAGSAYEMARSLRFRSNATSFLNKTFASTGNQRQWTWSSWIKLGSTSTSNILLQQYSDGDNQSQMRFGGPNNRFYDLQGAGFVCDISWSPVHRDPSAWYHVVFVVDTTQATNTNRIKFYVNGVQITSTSSATWPSQNATLRFNGNNAHFMNQNGVLASLGAASAALGDSYRTETNFIDGQSLDPSYFGYFDPITNIWQPKKYTGGYGTNGFYLPFSENNSLTNLGRNFAGSNYRPYSQTFSDASWQKNNVTLGAAVTAPDGSNTAVTLTDNSTLGNHTVYGSSAVTTVAGATYTLSAFAKAGTHTIFGLWETNSTGTWATYNLVTGTVTGTTGISATIESVGNGWYRCILTLAAGGGSTGIGLSTANSNVYPGNNYVGTGTNLFIWGAQINLGNSVDRYIQTVASASNNDWTTNNFSLNANISYDSMVDSPTNVFTTANDTGGVVTGNYATLNPLIPPYSSASVYVNSNLRFTVNSNGGATDSAYSTIPMSSGKWYAECTVTATPSAGTAWIGVCNNVDAIARGLYGGGVRSTGYAYKQSTGNKCNGDNTGTAYGAAYTTGDIISVALDLDARNITFYKNNVSQGVAFTNITSNDGNFVFGVDSDPVGTFTWNFGQQPFTYTPPAGFKSLNTTNIQALGTSVTSKAAITPNKYFDISLYPGTGINSKVTNSGFQPDLVWLKSRSTTTNHRWYDSVRGANVTVSSNTADAEGTPGGTGGVIQFNSNGFTLGSAGSDNASGVNFVGWQWKAGGTAVTNTAGILTSQVSANTSSGFSVCTYTAPASSQTNSFGHGLGIAPSMVIAKNRSSGTGGLGWAVYHISLGSGKYLTLNSTAAAGTSAGYWGSGMTNTVVGLPTAASSTGFDNCTGNMVAYCFAPVAGYSAFGSYTGNGSADGPFIYTGFQPRFILIRTTSGLRDWLLYDTSTSNPRNPATDGPLPPNITDVTSYDSSAYTSFDILSNGFKIKASTTNLNASGEIHIYMALAESPFALNNRAR